MGFPPILILAIIWLLIAPILSAAKKQQAKNAKTGAAKQSGARAPKKQPETGNSTHVTPEPARPTVMQPSITFTEHDDSVYQGSMNAITGEGFDPCHDPSPRPRPRFPPRRKEPRDCSSASPAARSSAASL